MADWKPKEFYTIRLDGIPVPVIADFLHGTLGLRADAVQKSHFYTEADGDFFYTDVLDLTAYFASRGSASFHLQTVRFDRAYRDGTCVICSDGQTAELECDIAETDFHPEKLPELETWLTEQVRGGIAEYADISYTFDNTPLFEIRKGELL